MKFDQRTLDKLTDPGDHWDPATPGLVLRVYASGVKTWYFVYRMGGRASRKRWLKVASFDALPLNRAQERARAYAAQRDAGVDPGDALKAAAAAGTTVAKLWERFEQSEYYLKRAPRTRSEYAITYAAHLAPKLGSVPVHDLTKERVSKWHGAIASPTAANRALAVLSRMMTLGIEVWELPELKGHLNPCKHVERNPETPRLRDITTAELVAIGKACKALEGVHSIYALEAIRVTLLCWGRVSEVLSLRRDRDVDLEAGVALIRDHKAARKMGTKRLEIPPPAVAILRRLDEEKGNPYYFPGRRKGQPLTRMGLYHAWLAVCEEAGVRDIHLHDARSLGASEAEAQGLNPKTAAAILGHKDERTTQKHYTRVRKAREAAAAVAAPIAAALGELDRVE